MNIYGGTFFYINIEMSTSCQNISAKAGAEAGAKAGAKAGAEVYNKFGTKAGVWLASKAGVEAGTKAGALAGAEACVKAGASASASAGAKTGATAGAKAGAKAGAEAYDKAFVASSSMRNMWSRGWSKADVEARTQSRVKALAEKEAEAEAREKALVEKEAYERISGIPPLFFMEESEFKSKSHVYTEVFHYSLRDWINKKMNFKHDKCYEIIKIDMNNIFEQDLKDRVFPENRPWKIFITINNGQSQQYFVRSDYWQENSKYVGDGRVIGSFNRLLVGDYKGKVQPQKDYIKTYYREVPCRVEDEGDTTCVGSICNISGGKSKKSRKNSIKSNRKKSRINRRKSNRRRL
jgi:hypothetical protein